MLFCVSCAAPDYTEHISNIDLHIKALDNAQVKLNAIRTDSMSALGRKVEADMKLVSKRYLGELPIEKAKPLNDYRGIKSLVKKTKPIIANAEVEIPEVRNQLILLRKALYEGATRDAKGEKIDKDYAEKAISNEKLAAEYAINQVDDIEHRVNMVFSNYEQFFPSVVQFIDSLRNLPQ